MLLAVVLIAAGATSLPAKDASEASLLDFVIGDYAVIGREPDGGATYAGSARIEPAEGGVTLKERRGGHEVTASGKLEVPSPPGEGRVLRFRWQDGDPMVMTCLIAGDLDNYARLTCYWLREGSVAQGAGSRGDVFHRRLAQTLRCGTGRPDLKSGRADSCPFAALCGNWPGRATTQSLKGSGMRIDPSEGHPAMDYAEHQNTYKLFTKLTLYTIVGVVGLMALLYIFVV
jgi:hypothetical protein